MGKVIEYGGADLYPKQRDAIFDPARISLIESSTKAGKGHPLDTLIYTPTGPRRLGDIEIGDEVLTPTGVTRVTGVFPLGVRDIYEVSFRNGNIVECTEDHLWEVDAVRASAEKRLKRQEAGIARRLEAGLTPRTRDDARTWPRVMTVAELARRTPASLKRKYVPTIQPVQYASRPITVDPYLLGVLIGDGSLSSRTSGVRFTSADEEIVERVRWAIDRRFHRVAKEKSKFGYRIGLTAHWTEIPRESQLAVQVEALGLMGKRSYEKRIPEAYRYNLEEVRWGVLQGLMDTDGFVNHVGYPMIAQTSPELALDIEELTEGLGGFVRTYVKRSYYTRPDDTKVECRTHYRQVITHPDPERFFLLGRKVELCKRPKRMRRRYFDQIRKVGRAEARCISVADPRGLYLTEHLIPTHNTSGCLAWMYEQTIQMKEGQNGWWVAPVFRQAEIGFRRMCGYLPRSHIRGKPNQSKLRIQLANGAYLWFLSGERSNDLYGEDVYAAVIDEGSRLREDSWLALRTTLTATQGPARIIGNVHGRNNWFYKLCRLAEEGTEGMAYHRITWEDAVAAGVLDREEIEASRRDFARLGKMGMWNQLYNAVATAEDDNPFGLAAIEACLIDGETMKVQGSGDAKWVNREDLYPRAAGVDLAGRGAQNVNVSAETHERDFTALVKLDREGTATHVERFRDSHQETQERLLAALGPTMALIDSTGAGDQQVEAMQRRVGPRVEGYVFTQRSRQDLLEGLALALGENRLRFPDGPLRDELDSFEYAYTGGGVKYCVAPKQRVLRADLRWVPAGALAVGDELLAFDEHQTGHSPRKWHRSEVLAREDIFLPAHLISLEDGTEIVASSDHLWLTNCAGTFRWRATKELRGPHPTSRSPRDTPSRLLRLLDVWEEDKSYEAGYLAGAFDGEGCVSQVVKANGGYATRLTFTQKENEMLTKVKGSLDHRGFNWASFADSDRATNSVQLRGRRHELFCALWGRFALDASSRAST